MHASCQAQQIEDFIVDLAMLMIGMRLTSHGRDAVLIMAEAVPGAFPETLENYFDICKAFKRKSASLPGDVQENRGSVGRCQEEAESFCKALFKTSEALPEPSRTS